MALNMENFTDISNLKFRQMCKFIFYLFIQVSSGEKQVSTGENQFHPLKLNLENGIFAHLAEFEVLPSF